jgi:hypothetical protein
MKTVNRMFRASLLAGVLATPAWAAPDAQLGADVQQAFAGSTGSIELLDREAMTSTEGRFPLMAIPLAIAGVDIGLMALYWGVYVPNYGGGGLCKNCSSMIQQH